MAGPYAPWTLSTCTLEFWTPGQFYTRGRGRLSQSCPAVPQPCKPLGISHILRDPSSVLGIMCGQQNGNIHLPLPLTARGRAITQEETLRLQEWNNCSRRPQKVVSGSFEAQEGFLGQGPADPTVKGHSTPSIVCICSIVSCLAPLKPSALATLVWPSSLSSLRTGV